MRLSTKSIILILLIITGSPELFGQDIKFCHLNDGLSQNAEFVMLQDSEGFMWFSTKDELKGSKITSYKPNDFGNDDPEKIIQSSDESILMASNKGLFWDYHVHEEIRQFKFNPDKTNDIPEKNVFCVFKGLKGQIFILFVQTFRCGKRNFQPSCSPWPTFFK